MSASRKKIARPRARNLMAVKAHFRKAGAIEPVKGRLPRKAKHKKKLDF